MAYTRTWNSSYEDIPADGDNTSEGATRARHHKTDTRERIAKDHYMDIGGTDADHGEHVKVSLRVGSAPTHAANKILLYGKDVTGKCELFAIDEDGDEVQLTDGGLIAGGLEAGTEVWFYQDSAPTGWTINATPSDELLAVKGGSTYTTGGATAGTWTMVDHTHSHSLTAAGQTIGTTNKTSGNQSASHTHNVNGYNNGTVTGTFLASSITDSVRATVATTTQSASHTHTTNITHTHAASSVSGTVGTGTAAGSINTWRQKARVGIICSKD